MDALDPFRDIWLCDFEFAVPQGERPTPVCMVAREWRTGQVIRLWQDQLAKLQGPPFSVGPENLFIAYYASAELGCFLALDWPAPARILDLFTEFRNLTNGLPTLCGSGLLGALAYFGLDCMATAEKDSMRQLAMRGGPYTVEEQHALLDYCQTDVDALDKLLPKMLSRIDLPRALLRGRYMAAAARMEWNGVPIDCEALDTLKGQWPDIKAKLIAAVDKDYGVFAPTGRRQLDPANDAEIICTAQEYGIDPYQLAVAVEHIFAEERSIDGERLEALHTAQGRTGLTPHRIARWEDAGKDSSTWPALDVTARQLAGEFPALGIGPGYSSDEGPDENDYAGNLWGQLREGVPQRKRKSDPDILRRAAEMVGDSGPLSLPMSFSAERFADYLAHNGIPWPQLASGALDLSDDAFRQMARQYPAVAPIRELRYSLSQLRLHDLAVGTDGRNRCLLSAFRARTGRNQPSNSRFIFGPATWLRGLIRPEPGRAVAYVDWSAQEIGIAAALSGDKTMMNAYAGDPYLWLAKAGGFAPPEATKGTHKEIRETFKVVYLAANYGMAERSLAQLIGKSEAHARELLHLHRERFPTFWKWSDAALDQAMLYGRLWSVFGWQIQVGPDTKPTSLRNFPVQGNGAEMLRLACCLATERGLQICCPVHDALLVEGQADEIDTVVVETQQAMREASELVLSGFPLRTEAKIVRYPDRYLDIRGERFWQTVWGLIGETTPITGDSSTPATGDNVPLPPVEPPSNLFFSSSCF